MNHWLQGAVKDSYRITKGFEAAKRDDSGDCESTKGCLADTNESAPFVNRMYSNPKPHRAGRACGAEINLPVPAYTQDSSMVRLRSVLSKIAFDARVRSTLTIRTTKGTQVIVPESQNKSVSSMLV